MYGLSVVGVVKYMHDFSITTLNGGWWWFLLLQWILDPSVLVCGAARWCCRCLKSQWIIQCGD